MDVRSVTGMNNPLYEVNREERFFSAILYSLLVQNNTNLKVFVSYLNSKMKKAEDRVDAESADQMDVYFEYAYLRDIWNKCDEEKRRRLIFSWLKQSKISLARLEVPELNEKLVGLGKPSLKHIQSPGTWSISTYAKHFPSTQRNNEEFEMLTKFKWCFKIKPDLVIQVAPRRVLSIEAKLEYGESTYPSMNADKKEWDIRKLRNVKQTELQILMFKSLLGTHVSMFRLVKRKPGSQNEDIPAITWKEAFAELDLSQAHPSVARALKAKRMI